MCSGALFCTRGFTLDMGTTRSSSVSSSESSSSSSC
eukprot:CAMPEP_0204291580 /NCGR_PEP_ID=MMETSP0468-20130131/62771_1 /ASSEMBLY_ACC=CAM_ASM_000383 /TAXON_ID=2969 /ORGANISM="Oxyrrhis marina" /LENGTH=35 /DNA_ID= /DNA_START= /DNA_END= /DNA_ORIENTATION=